MSSVALASAVPPPSEGRDALRWGASFALVLGLHAAVLAGVVAYRGAVSEVGEALPAVMIDLAPPPSAPTAAPSEAPPSEASPEMTAPDPVPEAPPDVPIPEVQPPAPVVETREPPPPEPPPPIPAAAEPVTPPPPIVQDEAAVSLPPPAPPRAAPVRPRERVQERRPPRPAAAPRAPRREARRPPSQDSGAPNTTAAISRSSGSSAASRSSWQGALVAALNRAKRPQNETGLASVRFSIDRSGRVLSAALAGSAGTAALDAEALALVRRAGLPAAPPDVTGATFTFTVPIRFTSR